MASAAEDDTATGAGEAQPGDAVPSVALRWRCTLASASIAPAAAGARQPQPRSPAGGWEENAFALLSGGGTYSSEVSTTRINLRWCTMVSASGHGVLDITDAARDAGRSTWSSPRWP
eukprot:174058-Prymnesium_polylepis.2